MKKPFRNILLTVASVCVLSVYSPIFAAPPKVTEDTKVLFENSEETTQQGTSLVKSYSRIAQLMVGLSLAIYLIVVIKKVYEAKGEGSNAIVSWASALILWLIMSEVIIKLMNTNITQ